MKTHILNEYFDEIFVINLKRRKDRFVDMSQKLSRLGINFTIIEAEDGYSQDNIELYNNYLSIPLGSKESHPLDNKYKRKTLMGPGAIGYLKSQRKILLRAKKKQYKKILIFDDDIILRENFNVEVKKFIDRLKINWKICMFGATQHVWNMPISHEFVDKELKIDYYPKLTDGSFALGISKNVYDEIIEKIENYNIAFDSGILRDLYSKYPTDCIVAFPYLVIADVTTSDIGNNRDQYELSAKLKWDIENFDFPFANDLISIIIPTYNKEKYIEKSIQSLLLQSYHNIEILIQDDYSTDKTQEICHDLEKQDYRIKYKRNAVNEGCYKTRNNALRRSKGNYIAIHDPDEISVKNRILWQIYDIIKNDILFSIGHIRRSRLDIKEMFLGDDDKLIEKVDKYRKKPINGNYEWTDRKILGLQTSMFKRNIFINYGLFWEEKFSADAEILERILYDQLGILFPYQGQNVYQLLYRTDKIDNIYKRNENILCISPIMNSDNLTNKYKGNIRINFENNYRLKLIGEFNYDYPKFSIDEINNYKNIYKEESNTIFNWKKKNHVKFRINETEYDLLLKQIGAKNKQIKNLKNTIDWYILEINKVNNWYTSEVKKITQWHKSHYKNLPNWLTKILKK